MFSISNSFPLPPPLLTEIRSSRTLTHLHQLHALSIKTGRFRDPLLAAEILRSAALAQHRHLHYALSILQHMQQPNLFSYNTLIRAFSETHAPLQSLLIFSQLLLHHLPNQYTFPSLLKACTQSNAINQGLQIHAQIIKLGLAFDPFVLSNLARMYALCGLMEDARRVFERRLEEDLGKEGSGEALVVLWNVMVDGYMKIGAVEEARRLFGQMPWRSVVSWNGMVAGFVENNSFEDALEMFREMQMGGFSPNYVTLVSVLPAISCIGAICLGQWIHGYAVKREIKVNDELASALIDMYSKCGKIGFALQVFGGCMSRMNYVAWNAIIGGLAVHGRGNEAIECFAKLEQLGVTPNDITFIGLLTACSHAGLVDEGRFYFERMIRGYGISPRIEHYGCMVDLFGRAGILEEAEELILNMPMKPDDVIWKALLSACKIHGNVEMGERVAKQLMELVPYDSGCYVLLSNLYASLGKWNAVAGVRLIMKEREIMKDPGCSWIEIDGTIHEFVVEDDSHPRTKEIRFMLEEITERLKSTGYAPDTSHVLLNVDEEERESVLYYHSEKIAIAFGLISTSQSTTLHVVKNLRMCGDCHSSLKIISKLYDRKILVRDRVRFHHFEDGECSCGDYW